MSTKMWQKMYEEANSFYGKLEKDNKVAFAKLGSSSGMNAKFPEFSKHVEDIAENEVGSWMLKDPSILAFKSWLVAKWDSWAPELQEELAVFNKVAKIFMVFILPMVVAMVCKVAADPESFDKFYKVVDLLLKLGIFVMLAKVVQLAKIAEFVLYKQLGMLVKLEFSFITAGGNVNKLLSMSASKLSMIEMRSQVARSCKADTGRELTNYLVESYDQSESYLTVGLERRAKTWFDTRVALKDVDQAELEAAWVDIKKTAFHHAVESLNELQKINEVEKYQEDFEKVAAGISKLNKLLKDSKEHTKLAEL